MSSKRNPLARQLSRLRDSIEDERLLLTFAVQKLGGRLVLTPEDAADAARSTLTIQHTSANLIAETRTNGD